MTLVSPFVVGVSKMLNGPQGGKIIEHVNKFQEKDDKLREEHPGRWASKKLAKGIAKGVLGVPFTDN